MATAPTQQKRVCFVTVGATASFDGLIEAVLSQAFFDALAAADYTQLLIQHGRGKGTLERFREQRARGQIDTRGIAVEAFAFSEAGLTQQMRAAKGADGVAAAAPGEGVVISHAGMS